MILHIVDEEHETVQTVNLAACDLIPYLNVRVQDFYSENRPRVAWTTLQFLKDGNAFFGDSPNVTGVSGFRRSWEITDYQSHKLGNTLILGRELSYPRKIELVKKLEASGLFDVVSELDHDPTQIIVQHRVSYDNPLLPFETISEGDVSSSVFVLQDALWALGEPICKLDGQFYERLDEIVRDYQSQNQLVVDGIVGPQTWNQIFHELFIENEMFRTR